MPQIEWNEKFSVGHEELDRQHRKWLGFIERLQHLTAVDSENRAAEDILDEMAIYTRYHFRSEERMLEEAGYGDLENHRRQHDAMSRRIDDLVTEFRTGENCDSTRIVDTLWAWLVEHIMHSDNEYVDTLDGATADLN